MDGQSINQSINRSINHLALSYDLLYTQSALKSYQGISPQTTQMCSIHLDNVTAATTMVPVCSPHTAIGGEDKE